MPQASPSSQGNDINARDGASSSAVPEIIAQIAEALRRPLDVVMTQIQSKEALADLIKEIQENAPELYKEAFNGNESTAQKILSDLARENRETESVLRSKSRFFEAMKAAGVGTVKTAMNILLYPVRHPIHTAIAAVLFMLATPYAASWFAGFERTLAAAGPMKKIIDYIRTLLPLSSVAAGGYKKEVFALGTAAF